MDNFTPSIEIDLAMHEMALESGQSEASRALFARRDSERVHLVVERLARAVNIVPEDAAGRGISIDKQA
jgi:hypothetical protein